MSRGWGLAITIAPKTATVAIQGFTLVGMELESLALGRIKRKRGCFPRYGANAWQRYIVKGESLVVRLSLCLIDKLGVSVIDKLAYGDEYKMHAKYKEKDMLVSCQG